MANWSSHAANTNRRQGLQPASAPWRATLYRVIFLADTPAGKAFDVALILTIVASIGAVWAESVQALRESHRSALLVLEWALTAVFSLEYALRLLAVKEPRRYIFSFYGLVDVLAILPTLLSLFVAGAQSLLVIRTLRLLRVFRLFKLGRYVLGADQLMMALRASLPKIIVFLFSVVSMVLILGSAMYLIEGEANGFTSIPRSVYWAIVTLTTVGYGDITPQTVPGQTLAAIVMMLGYGIIAVPTGIVSVELAQASRNRAERTRCAACGRAGHEPDAQFCKHCGGNLEQAGEEAAQDASGA